jgi:hypothetical protein
VAGSRPDVAGGAGFTKGQLRGAGRSPNVSTDLSRLHLTTILGDGARLPSRPADLHGQDPFVQDGGGPGGAAGAGAEYPDPTPAVA